MPDLERTYIIPLRKEYLKVPRYKRTQKAVKTVRAFLQKHMKEENVLLGIHLNQKLHEHGRKNPPSKIEVKAIKFAEKDKVVVKAELPNIKIERPKEEKKSVGEKLKEKVLGKAKEAEIVEEKPKEKLEEEQEKKEVLEHEKVEKKPMHQIAKDQSIQSKQKLRRERVVTATGKK